MEDLLQTNHNQRPLILQSLKLHALVKHHLQHLIDVCHEVIVLLMLPHVLDILLVILIVLVAPLLSKFEQLVADPLVHRLLQNVYLVLQVFVH